MNSQQVFYINLILGLILLAYFWLGRSSRQKSPTKLNLKATGSSAEPLAVNSQSLKIVPQPAPVQTSAQVIDAEIVNEVKTPVKTRELNIYFMYNGHDWEAHDVLGIPRGASLAVATQVYQDLIKKSDPSTLEFYEAAYSTLMKKKRNERL